MNGTKEEHLDMLDGGIIQRLLEEKWKTFARVPVYMRVLFYVTHFFLESVLKEIVNFGSTFNFYVTCRLFTTR